MQTTGELPPAYNEMDPPPPYTDLIWKELHKVNITATEEPYTIYAWYSVNGRVKNGTSRADFGYGYSPHSPEYYFSCCLTPELGHKSRQLAKHAEKIMLLYLEHRRIHSCDCSLVSFGGRGFTPYRGPTRELDALGLKHFLLDQGSHKCKDQKLGLSGAFRSWFLSQRLQTSLYRHGYMCACGCLRTRLPVSYAGTFMVM